MINIVCVVSSEEEIKYIKKQIEDAILYNSNLPYRQRYVIPGDKNRPMYTDNCRIDFRSPNPDKIAGIHADIVIGTFDCDYSDDIIYMIIDRSDPHFQKKYGHSDLPIWDIVLDIEERYKKSMEVMFND